MTIAFKYLVIASASIALSCQAQCHETTQSDSLRFWNAIRPVSDSMGKAYNFWTMAVKGKWEGLDTDSLHNEYLGLRNLHVERVAAFIRTNPDNRTALEYFRNYVLNQRSLTLDSVRAMFLSFSENLRRTSEGMFIDSALERKRRVSLDAPAPDLSFQSVNGDRYTIASFHGRPVLLCFWASWCGPCIRNIPMLQKIHEQYGDKLQMVSISIDRDELKWKAALGKYKMKWLQTCDIAPYAVNSQFRTTYDIQFIPEYILLDGDGRIIYQNYILKDDSYEILRSRLNALK